MKNILDLKEKIRDFIISNFYIPNANDLRNDMSVFDTGIIDSTGVMELIAFIENEFSIQVEDHEVIQDNFDCVDKIVSFVLSKKSNTIN
jgi:acyl carrier protein